MSEVSWNDRVAHLVRLATGCLLPTLNAPLSAQTPPPQPAASPSAATWNATRHITILASYVHFFAGPFLKETPPGKDLDHVTLWVDYTF